MAPNETLGDIQIVRDNVFNTIAGIAMSEVDGVISLSGKSTRNPFAAGKGQGVKAEINNEDKKVSLTLDVKIVYGYVIYDTAKRLQQRVKNAVEQMIGYTVEGVKVNVVDIVVPEPEPEDGESNESDDGKDNGS